MVSADLVGVCCVYIVCCTETKSSRLEEVLILKFCCKDLLAYYLVSRISLFTSLFLD